MLCGSWRIGKSILRFRDPNIDEKKDVTNIEANSTDFTFSTYKQTKIVTEREYWDNFKPE